MNKRIKKLPFKGLNVMIKAISQWGKIMENKVKSGVEYYVLCNKLKNVIRTG